MDVCFECCVLLGSGLCEELIRRPEESYRVQRVYDLETSGLSRWWPAALYIDCVAETFRTQRPGHAHSLVMHLFWAGQPPPPLSGQSLLIHEVSRSHTTTHHSR
jgi:hypothetical protein